MSMRKILKDLIDNDEIKIQVNWHPDKELSVSQYENMVTNYVQTYIKGHENAEYLRFKEFSDRQKSDTKNL